MKKRILSLAIVFCMVSALSTPVTASDLPLDNDDLKLVNSDNSEALSFENIISKMNITIPEDADVSLQSVSLYKGSNTEGAVRPMTDTDVIELPAIVVTTQNNDGTMVSTAYFSLVPDENGNLKSSIDITDKNDGSGVSLLSYSPSVANHTVELSATHANMVMPNGMAYIPSVSSVKITGQSNTISGCMLYSLLTGQYLATSYSSYVDSWPYYENSKNIGRPTMGTMYSISDYTAYTSDSYEYGGYNGKYIYIVHNGFGSYIVKCQFNYNSTMYTVVYGVYNYPSYAG